MRARPAIGLLLLTAVGCGSSIVSDPTMVPLGSWDREYAAVNCARIFGCCDAAERSARWTFTSEGDCRRQVQQAGGAYVRDVTAGFLVYDARVARRCLDEIAAAPCADVFNTHDARTVAPSCERVTRGARKSGEYCQGLDMYCESQNCVLEGGDDLCGPPRACPPTWCGAGLYCDEAAGCLPVKPAGAACATNLECESLTCGAVSCEAKEPDGAACSEDENCASGACSRPGGVGVCGPPQPDGATCYTDAGCASGTCVIRSLARPVSTCGAPFCDGA